MGVFDYEHDDEECRLANLDLDFNKAKGVETIWGGPVPTSLIAHNFGWRFIPMMAMAILTDKNIPTADFIIAGYAAQKRMVTAEMCRVVFAMGLDKNVRLKETEDLNKLWEAPAYDPSSPA